MTSRALAATWFIYGCPCGSTLTCEIAAARSVDLADWKFVREIDTSQVFDFEAEMASFMPINGASN
jgi:hypothetical protein